MATYDPYQILPFRGYVDSSTGERERYLSLAHFYHHMRLAGSDLNLRQHLASIDCPELFRIEAEGVGYQTTVQNWADLEVACLKAGLYMQAVEQKDFFSYLLNDVSKLSFTSCAFGTSLATALSEFVESLSSNEGPLKVFFAGDASPEFANQCFDIIFAKKNPD